MNFKLEDLKVHDIVELFNDQDFIFVLADEWDYDLNSQKFVTDEDSTWYPFQCVSRIWRENEQGDYKLIFVRV